MSKVLWLLSYKKVTPARRGIKSEESGVRSCRSLHSDYIRLKSDKKSMLSRRGNKKDRVLIEK